MDYITTKEAATHWKISDRRVLQYCNEKKIDGAQKIGGIWLIPKTTTKPVDGRTKSERCKKNEQ